MKQVVVKLPEEVDAEVRLELRDGEVLVLGRAPAESAVEVPGRTPRAVPLASPAVSASHVAVWLEDDAVQVRDLASRNGTRVLAPTTGALRADAGVLVLELGDRAVTEAADRPLDARWDSARHFGEALLEEIGRWLDSHGVNAELSLEPRVPDGAVDDPCLIPLWGGGALRVRFRSTVDGRWRGLLRVVWTYVHAQEELARSEAALREEGLILASPLIRAAHRRVIEASRRGARLMLIGPSGAGKEGLARVFHRHGTPEGPFVALNCSLFHRELLQAQLFGAEPGSFTGATRRLVGAVERAHGGTLFLDELGDLDPEVQPALLRFLDRGEYERLGEPGVLRRAEVKVVVATNKDLRAAVLRGEFRADLWYRLAGQVVDVAPLKSRIEDLRAFLRERRHHTGASLDAMLAPDARALLERHDWSGNFRELEIFADHLQAASLASPLDARACARLLEGSSLTPVRLDTTPPTAAPLDWAASMRDAVDAFSRELGRAPADWPDVKDLLEKFLKPLLFARLAGLSELRDPATLETPRVAARMNADRGTVAKQFARYLELTRRRP